MTDPRRRLPSVNDLVARFEQAGAEPDLPRAAVVDAARSVVAAVRAQGGVEPPDDWVSAVRRELIAGRRTSLQPVINATGVVLHTNLGRAPLPAAAVAAMERAARYVTLEYDLEAGTRGSRQVHAQRLLRALTGAEDTVVVNNAASALVLVLNALADGGETLVSRGELVEIGGAFRLPDVLATSGSILVEVGTTNRTRMADYEHAVSPRTKCVLKVHRSNFTQQGFTSEVDLAALVARFAPRRVPVVHDVGSGLLVDLAPYGLAGEPLIRTSVETGAIVVCSGDKLLGGPQAGLVLGPSEAIVRMRANPLARALRPDKLVLAALEATLAQYEDPDRALRTVPTLAMLVAAPDRLARRAAALAAQVEAATTRDGTSSVGGGSFPAATLPTTLMAVPTAHPDAFLARLRRANPPVIARADDGCVLFDPRTVDPSEESALVSAIRAAAG